MARIGNYKPDSDVNKDDRLIGSDVGGATKNYRVEDLSLFFKDDLGTVSKVTVGDSTSSTNFPVIFHDESDGLLDDTGSFTYNPSSGTLVVSNLDVSTNVDIDGTLEADAITVNGTTLADYINNNVTGVEVTESSANTYYPIVLHNGSNALLEDASNASGTAFKYNPSTGVLTAKELDISHDVDIDGTANLDAAHVTAYLTVEKDAPFSVGGNGVGHGGTTSDVNFYGSNDGTWKWDTATSGTVALNQISADVTWSGKSGAAGDGKSVQWDYITGALTLDAASISGTAVKDENDMASDSATHLASQQSIKAYVDAGAGYTAEKIQDVVGAMFSGNTETNISATYQDTDGTIDLVATGTAYTAGNGLTLNTAEFDLDAALTTVTSILNTSLVTGRDADNQIKYSTDNEIIFRVAGGDGITMKASGEIEATKFDGALEGNADTATALASGRTIGMTGDVGWTSASFDGSGNVTGTSTIQADSVHATMINDDLISGSASALTSGLASTDELLISDAGTLKNMDVSVLQTYMQSNLTFTSNTDVDVSNANLLTRLAALESSGGSGDENITIGTDSGDTIVITGNLQVSGTTTTVNSTTVNLNDHNIVLDSGNSTSAVIDGAGITLEGGSGTDATFTYSTTGPKFEMKLGSDYEDLQVSKLIADELDIDGVINVGVDDTGYDVKFFGATSGQYMLWDESADKLIVSGSLDVSNGVTLTGSHLDLADEVKVIMGDGNDFQIYHDPGTVSSSGATLSVESWITSGSGNLAIHNSATDGDIIFITDDGSGGNATYMTLDGGTKSIDIGVPLNVGVDDTGYDVKFFGATSGRYLLWDESDDSLNLADNTKLKIGTSGDLELYHDASNSYIVDGGTGDLIIQSTNLKLRVNNTEDAILCDANAGVTLYYDGGARISATNAGATVTGALTVTTDADIDGTLEADAYTVDGTALNEYIADTVGAMFTSNTETNITATYQDADNTIDLVVPAGGNAALNDLSDVLIENNSIWIGNDPSSTTSTAEYNVGVGTTALDAITSGDNNTTVGYGAGGALTTGGSHVAIGKNALALQTDSSGIVAIGGGAMASMTNTSPGYIVAIGSDALGGTDGSQLSYNVAIGYASQNYAEGSNNVSIGAYTLDGSGSTAMEGENNTAIGNSALTAVTNGDDNTVVGYSSGHTITTGGKNTYVGGSITASAVDVDNEIVIGQGVTGKGSNTVLLGNTNTTAWLPADDNGVDLGSAALSFKDAWIQGTLTVGPITASGALTVGVDDTGYDVKLFGATSGRYLLWDESDDALEFNDSVKATFGTGADLVIQHDSNNSYIDANGTGDLIIEQMTADKDIILKCDDGSGGETAYITLDGSTSKVTIGRDADFNGDVTLANGNSLRWTSDDVRIEATTASDNMKFYVGGSEILKLEQSGTLATVTGDVDVTGSVKVTQNLRRTVTAVSHSTNTFTCTLTANDNFSFTLNNTTNTINIVAATENVGQSGTIVITNPSSVGSLAVNAIQGNGSASEVLTPEGATINWPTGANNINIMSYYVAAADKILINFVGNFA